MASEHLYSFRDVCRFYDSISLGDSSSASIQMHSFRYWPSAQNVLNRIRQPSVPALGAYNHYGTHKAGLVWENNVWLRPDLGVSEVEWDDTFMPFWAKQSLLLCREDMESRMK